MRISDWSSDVCSSDLPLALTKGGIAGKALGDSERVVVASGLFRWLEPHTNHEPDGRSVKLLIRKGRKQRKGKTPRTSKSGCRFRRRSEEHTSELQSLMRISYAVFCLKKKKNYEYEETLHKKTTTTRITIE